jgi:hypothetical protein
MLLSMKPELLLAVCVEGTVADFINKAIRYPPTARPHIWLRNYLQSLQIYTYT